MSIPAEQLAESQTPLHWVRQRAGDPETITLTADEAAMIAQRPGAVGDYMKPAGLVWREPNPDARGGYDFFTITPVYPKPSVTTPEES